MAITTTASLFCSFVGIDISKQALDCWLRPDGLYKRFPNTSKGFDQLHEWLLQQQCRRSSTIICVENTGIYGKRLLMALTNQGWSTALEKTTALDHVGPSHHRKDDPFDASLLAEYADRFADQLQLYEPAEEPLQRIQQLYSERRRLVRQRTSTQTKQTQARQQPIHCELLHQSWQDQLQLLDNQITALEEAIQRLVDTHEGLAHYYRLLTGIPGIGQVTSWLWLILFYGQVRLNPKKIASRFGFAPHCRRSGSSVQGKTRSSGHGQTEMRASMSLAARSASTHYKKFNDYKERKLEEGKPWPVVRNNMINKLITIMCAIWNSGDPYDPNHTSRFDRQKNAA